MNFPSLLRGVCLPMSTLQPLLATTCTVPISVYSSPSPVAVQATDDPSNVLCSSPLVSPAPPSQLTFPRPTSLVPGNRRLGEDESLTQEFGQPEESETVNLISYHAATLSLVWQMYSPDM